MKTINTTEATGAEPRDVEIIESAQGHWWCVEEDNTYHRCETESEACAFQRGYRVAQGLHPMTGEPA